MNAKIKVNITELRSIGAVPVSIVGLARRHFLAVPREAVVEVSSLAGGIQGSVICTIVDDAGSHYVVQIPQGDDKFEQMSVSKSIVQALNGLGEPAHFP